MLKAKKLGEVKFRVAEYELQWDKNALEKFREVTNVGVRELDFATGPDYQASLLVHLMGLDWL